MAYSNQFTFEIKSAELVDVVIDEIVSYGNPKQDHAKVVAVFKCSGPEEKSDEIAVTLFDERADKVAEAENGSFFDLSVKLSSKIFDGKNGPFASTDVLAFYAKQVDAPEPAKKETRTRRGGEDQAKKQQSNETGQGDNHGSERSQQTRRPTGRR